MAGVTICDYMLNELVHQKNISRTPSLLFHPSQYYLTPHFYSCYLTPQSPSLTATPPLSILPHSSLCYLTPSPLPHPLPVTSAAVRHDHMTTTHSTLCMYAVLRARDSRGDAGTETLSPITTPPLALHHTSSPIATPPLTHHYTPQYCTPVCRLADPIVVQVRQQAEALIDARKMIVTGMLLGSVA